MFGAERVKLSSSNWHVKRKQYQTLRNISAVMLHNGDLDSIILQNQAQLQKSRSDRTDSNLSKPKIHRSALHYLLPIDLMFYQKPT